MDFFEAALKRYSYRDAFMDQPVPEEDIRKILEAAIQAPSGWNLQSTSFTVVTDPEVIAGIAEILPMDAVATAKALIVTVTNHIEAEGFCFEVEDYGIACAYIMLGTTALGYATVCLDGDVQEADHREKIAALIGAPQDATVRAVFPIGVPEGEGKQAPRKPFEERVRFI